MPRAVVTLSILENCPYDDSVMLLEPAFLKWEAEGQCPTCHRVFRAVFVQDRPPGEVLPTYESMLSTYHTLLGHIEKWNPGLRTHSIEEIKPEEDEEIESGPVS